MKHFDIIILGAGASGCMCALTCTKSGKNVLMIDKLTKAGKKILATGNGRCNLSNQNMTESKKFYNQNIDSFLSRFGVKDTIQFFNKLGLLTYSDDEGRIYPISNSAKSVVDVINNEISKYKNLTSSLDTQIEKIVRKNNIFEVFTNNGTFCCEKLVVAMGGKSAEEILHSFAIKTKPFVPSLVALKTDNIHSLDGIKVSNVKVEAICGKKRYCDIGEILFKESGISGIVTFNVSTLFARENNFQGSIYIDLMPNLTEENLKNFLNERRSLNIKIKNFFDGMFVNQLGYYILNLVKIKNEERLSNTLTDLEIENFAKIIKNITLEVKGCYENNQVYSGGVCLEELKDNLESKKVKNLFFCGEVCDVDGICGGYNLQWAWTSGHIVGESL